MCCTSGPFCAVHVRRTAVPQVQSKLYMDGVHLRKDELGPLLVADLLVNYLQSAQARKRPYCMCCLLLPLLLLLLVILLILLWSSRVAVLWGLIADRAVSASGMPHPSPPP